MATSNRFRYQTAASIGAGDSDPRELHRFRDVFARFHGARPFRKRLSPASRIQLRSSRREEDQTPSPGARNSEPYPGTARERHIGKGFDSSPPSGARGSTGT